MRIVTLGPAVLALGALLLGGCATAHRAALPTAHASSGDVTTDGGEQALLEAALQPHAGKSTKPALRLPPRRAASFGATIESSDPRLAAALLAEATLPTAYTHARVAQEYLRLGVMDAAFASLERALVKDPHMGEAHEGLARIWRDWGFPDRGLGSAYRAVSDAPWSASARNTLGTLLDRLGRSEEARTAYLEAAAIDSRAAWALSNLCNLEYRLGHLEDARGHCASALLVEPSLTTAHNNLALTYAASGDMASARMEFLAAGDPAAADYNMGILGLAEGNDASAALAFEDAIKARPGFTAAKDRARAARFRLLTKRP
jgi:tetratricopeptide (TPR) repeat protein